MHQRLSFVFILLFLASSAWAQLQSPEQFLGYKIGSRYTPHWRIVEYYKHVAAAAPSMVKLQPYGQTNEGRPLLVAYVSSAANVSNLELIRSNNLNIATTGNAPASGTPALVWLSYNVHGNETSSSEAGMLTLFALVDPANTQTKAWLQNTVVIIDPCLNPDGRDRYVSWFNSVSGKRHNPNLSAREHREPWPGGRSNHYNFDLNRDWAWQTQVESQQRLKLYNEWLPQIHVDFHEQGINSPYYFAPAAEPFHEVITPWQRRFQETIGRNHAKYFDKNGWLYFTKERFDLLYPSYGDTYPIYNGAIGMTYEQAGNSSAGASVLLENGDTLTLAERVMHHYTTGLSTVEIASQHAAKLLTEFSAFYKNALTNGSGPYKSYIIKYDKRDAERIAALTELLRKNKIDFGYAKGGPVRGFNYDNSKEESFNISTADLVIPTTQPRGTLVKVLFEPSTKLSDSVTYDITAWSLPYAYGLKAIASKAAVPFTPSLEDKFATMATQNIVKSNAALGGTAMANTATENYGYIIRWSGVQSVKLVSQLLQKGIKLRFSQQPFQSGGEEFDRGAVLLLKTSNQYYPHFWDTVQQLANRHNIQLTPLTSGFVDKGYDFGSEAIRPLANRRIAVVTGEGISSLGAGEVWHFFDQVLEHPVTLINAADLSRADWGSFDVLVMPDGSYRFLSDKTAADALKAWITAGGNVVALEGAVAQLAKLDWTVKLKRGDDTSDANNEYGLLKKFESRERDYVPAITPGAIFKVELDNSHPLAFGYPNYYYTLKQDDNIYQFLKEGGWNVGVLKRGRQVAGFVGSRLSKRLQNGLLFGTQEVGRGSVTYLADDVLFRSFWEGGKLLFCNAVFLVGQ
jgi:hypothetical protein